MQDALSLYFNGEKYAGLLLAGLATAIAAASIIIFRAGPSLGSFALTLGLLALAQIALGAGLYLRTGPQADHLVDLLRSEPVRFYSAERVRMLRVQRNFVIVEYVEVLIIIVTAITAVAQKARPGFSGVALGLLITASLLLAFDVLAERRGAVYLKALGTDQRPY